MTDTAALGIEAHALVRDLFPICRSITGPGLRETLTRLGGVAPLELREVPSGTRVLDWTIPDEWTIRDAWLEGPDGQRVAEFARSNLHVVGYSEPVDQRLSLAELRPRLHTLPDHPDWTPWRTSYYERTWGFCLPHAELEGMAEGTWHARVDADLAPGALTFGELVLPGQERDEILISAHSCHPSLANDNLSAMAVAILLARELSGRSRRWTWRFVFAPGTIGAITWLALHQGTLPHLRGGLVLSGVGGPGPLTWKRSRRGATHMDHAMELALASTGAPAEVRPFGPWGYDERQYCSPGFNLPVGRLTRTPHGEYPEYHTSADNPDFVSARAMAESLDALLLLVDILEHDRTWVNREPFGEPQLGRRGLFGGLGGRSDRRELEHAMLWVLNQGDGLHSLVDVARSAGLAWPLVREAAQRLHEAGLLARDPEVQ